MKIKFNSLITRLIVVMGCATILPTIIVGWIAHDLIFENIRSGRITEVGLVADAKRNQLVMMLTAQHRRAELFLANLTSLCAGKAAKLDPICTAKMLKSYLKAEGALGANLHGKGGFSLSIGISPVQKPEDSLFQAGQLAKLSGTGPDNNRSFFISVVDETTGYHFAVSYPSLILESVFIPYPAELGDSGETFLADGAGYFVTQAKYHSTQGHSHPISARPMQSCLTGQSREMLDLDYRDTEIIHGFRFIPEFGSACIMAHITQQEAFVPLKLLEREIFGMIFLFGTILTIMAVFLAKRIMQPIARLSAVSNAIAAGDYQAQADVTGNDEISDLAASFNHMTNRLRGSINELQSLLDSMTEGMYGLDANGNCTFVNRSFLRLLGYQNENEVLGNNMHNLIHHSHSDGSPLPVSACRIYRAYQENQLTNANDEVFWRKDGVAIPVEYWSHPIVADGVVTGTIVTFIDITERKQAEAELRKLSLAVEQSPNSIVISNLDASIEYVNDTFLKLTGYSRDEVIGKNPRVLQSGKTPKAIHEDMWAHLTRGEMWRGELINKRKDGSEYIELAMISPVRQADGRISHYLAIKENITEAKKAEERIERLAHFDQLTGLPNRILLNDRFKYALSLAQRSNEPLAVMFLDLDHFKNVNDTLGHTIGDQLLMEVARRIKATLREEDTVSRQGGDEFMLILHATDADGAAQVAAKLIGAVSQPCQIEQYELITTLSIGITIYPDDGKDFETLSKNADAAMYRVKQSGRNDFRFYTPEMQVHSARTLQLANALRHALARNELLLHYQPQFSIQDGHIVGAEALLRWRHPELGMISPAEFIPIAEEGGQIIPIGEWVLRTAAKQLKDWIDSGLPPMVMAVNLSSVQFRQANITELITHILDEVQLPHEYLELELTEAVAMGNPLAAIEVMDKLYEHGIRMSIDDFGTGYSSLSYLKKFKVYKLKIDQSFVRDITDDPDDKAIVSAIINMASSLGIQTIAEGVETAGQLAFLRLQGCNEVQGYYFSKPLPADQFEVYVQGHSTA